MCVCSRRLCVYMSLYAYTCVFTRCVCVCVAFVTNIKKKGRENERGWNFFWTDSTDGRILPPPPCPRRGEKNGRWLSVTERGREIAEERTGVRGGGKRRRCLIGLAIVSPGERTTEEGGSFFYLANLPTLPPRSSHANRSRFPRSTDSSPFHPR